ncbi:MAG: hypothetical protein Q7R96_04470 [Nanoarchaeota archaeon]|nr:hypothetical protein [Nanoarchaeota archaeon]
MTTMTTEVLQTLLNQEPEAIRIAAGTLAEIVHTGLIFTDADIPPSDAEQYHALRKSVPKAYTNEFLFYMHGTKVSEQFDE